MSMRDILKKFDSVQSNTALNEDLRAVTLECGGVSEGPTMQSPITLNITMSSADQMAQLMRALSMINGGNDQVDGLKNNGTPVDDPSIPGRDDVQGDTDLNQGALGALAGGALGAGLGMATGQGAFGTTLGALSGAAAGDSLTDTDYDDPSIPGRDDVEGDTDLQAGAFASGTLGAAIGGLAGHGIGGPAGAAIGATLGGVGGAIAGKKQSNQKKLQAGSKDDPRIPGRDDIEGDVDLQQDIGAIGDLINKGASAVASSGLGQTAIDTLGKASDWGATTGATLGAKAGGAVADLVGPDTIKSLAGLPADTPDWAAHGGAALKGMEIGSNIGKYAPAAAAAGAGLAGASMLGGDNDDKQESSGDFEKSTTEPDEKYWDHDTMVNKLSGGINGKKRMYKPASQGDNAMAVESMKARLLKALDEASKKAKPDFLDMDKDGNKKEPMKKAVADKKKAPVKEGADISPTYIKHLKLKYGDKQSLTPKEQREVVNDILNRWNFNNIETIMRSDIPHVSQMAKLYLRNKTPGGMLNYNEAAKPVQEAVNETADLNRMKQFLKRLNG